MGGPKMSSAEGFFLAGRDRAPEPYHYTACGLDNIYLGNGFKLEKNSYGRGVSIEMLDDLHEAIARNLVQKPEKLTGKEIRFLRKQLNATQADLAQWLSSDVQAVGRYERGECEGIPGPVDKLVRTIYLIHTMPGDRLNDLIKYYEEVNPPPTEPAKPQIFSQRNSHWETDRVAA
jgi:DNA-binding transcriptional regulator YiaG